MKVSSCLFVNLKTTPCLAILKTTKNACRVGGGYGFLFAFYTPCLKKTAFLFLSELRHIFINFNNFWYVDGTVSGI